MFGRSRAELIKSGLLLDISPVGRQAFIEVPLAISPQLWRCIADDDPCDRKDPGCCNFVGAFSRF
jgi:hypothetical protein